MEQNTEYGRTDIADVSSEITPNEDGVETELEDTDEEINTPFDPEMIRIRTTNLLVSHLVSRIDHGEIDLAPDFQRLAGIWQPRSKSRLIESLLLRIPIPVFYVAADDTDSWSVVDGIQRMTTIHGYFKNGFPLQKLEYLTWLNGSTHEDLPRRFQRRISETQLIVNIIDAGTPPEVMFNVFLRINTGGVPLNRQEIRHTLNPGPARDYLRQLAQSQEFLLATRQTISPNRMADRECVLRFLAFYMDSWETYSSNDLDSYLGRAMGKLNALHNQQRTKTAQDFRKALKAAYEIFGDDTFRKITPSGPRRHPVNRALLESWCVCLARCSSLEIEALIGYKEDLRAGFVSLLEKDYDFERSISHSTGLSGQIRKRFDAIDKLVGSFL